MMNAQTPLIETVHLKKYFDVPEGKLHAVDDINLKIYEHKTLGIVGESGCGKSTLGRTSSALSNRRTAKYSTRARTSSNTASTRCAR